MKLRTVLIVTAVFFLINAAAAMIIPATALSLWGATPDPAINYMGRWAGLGSMAIGLLALFSRNIDNPEARRAVVLTMLIYFGVGTAISVLGASTGQMNAVGWLLSAIYALFAVGYAFLLFTSASAS